MPKRFVTLVTEDGNLKLRASFNVAADFEDETGIRVYGGDQEWLRTPSMVRKFVWMAARRQAEGELTEEQVGEMLSGAKFKDITTAIAEALFGDEAKGDRAKKGTSGKP